MQSRIAHTGPPPGGTTARSAREQILAALDVAGYSPAAARDLLDRADKEPRAGDTEFEATLHGGHALIVEYGDCELYGSCQCGQELLMVTPDKSLDRFASPWERHVMTEVRR